MTRVPAEKRRRRGRWKEPDVWKEERKDGQKHWAVMMREGVRDEMNNHAPPARPGQWLQWMRHFILTLFSTVHRTFDSVGVQCYISGTLLTEMTSVMREKLLFTLLLEKVEGRTDNSFLCLPSCCLFCLVYYIELGLHMIISLLAESEMLT